MQAIQEAPAQNQGRRQRSEGAPDDKRRLALLQRIGLFGEDTKGAIIARALTFTEIGEAYALVHDAFVEKEYMLPRASGMRVRPFETDSSTATFVARSDGQVVGCQSLVVDSPDIGLPSDKAFCREIDELRRNGALVCEATNEAVAARFRKSAVPTELMRCMFIHARSIGCQELITTVSPGHQSFYEFIGFEQVSPIRSYSDEIEDPVVVMCWHLEPLEAKWRGVDLDDDTMDAFWKGFCVERNPYAEHVEGWSRLAEGLFGDLGEVAAFFARCPELILGSTPQELDAVRQRLGQVAFAMTAARLHVPMARSA